MIRRDFIRHSTQAMVMSAATGSILSSCKSSKEVQEYETKSNAPMNKKFSYPVAITMWDFSWIERRWPGAGYEDWDKVLDELAERGYNAVRIDAFPHFIANDPGKEWTMPPVWNQEDWGSPAKNKIVIQPALNQFISKCKERGIVVGLSSWFREDAENVRMKIKTPEIMADYWIKTLQSIEKDNLIDNILYVDLCNEWPGSHWAPYFKNDPPELTWGGWYTTKSIEWMKKSVELVRAGYPDIPYCFSFDMDEEKIGAREVGFLDFLEPHIWMAQRNNQEFYKNFGYDYPLFSPSGYELMVEHAEKNYQEKPEYWQKLLKNKIVSSAQVAKKEKLPLITTECWAVVNYKDWPLLNWDWIKELCAFGVETAASTGSWIGIGTSNFCGPQFVGMWRDVKWHQQMTNLIRNAKVDDVFLDLIEGEDSKFSIDV